MSESTINIENQSQRWRKYGLNVALSIIIVLVLGSVVVAIAARADHRFDTTAGGEYSLKPQTLNIVHDLKEPITIVSLYTHPEHPAAGSTDYARRVSDLLDEYGHASSKITVETIDPVTDPGKVNTLIKTVTLKYGGEVRKYKEFVDSAPQAFAPIKAFAKNELPKLAKLPIDPMKNDDVNQTFSIVNDTIAGFPTRLNKVLKQVDQLSSQKVPDYKGAADAVQAETSRVGDIVTQIEESFAKLKSQPNLPVVFARYIDSSVARYDALKRQVDSTDAEYKKLGALKLDTLREKLAERDAILVMGPKDMRSLSFDQIWKPDANIKAYQNATDATIKPVFSGEQQITGAILSLTMKTKPLVVFIRPSGSPLTTPGFPPFQQGGPLSDIADRLRNYNFKVMEKDLSGKYAMQAQMQGMPAPPEPTEAQMKKAVWVVLSIPTPPPNPQEPAPPTPSIAPQLAEHLKDGGSALCLFLPKSDTLSDALKPYGIDVRTDLVAIHEPIRTQEQSNDMVQQAEKVPVVFVTHNYGKSVITKPVNGLDSVLVPILPITTTLTEGVKVTPIIPIPNNPKSWGTQDMKTVLNGGSAKFNAAAGDLAGPLYGGAMSQNDKTGGRVVAIGSLQFVTNQMLDVRDPQLAQRGILVSRFPANAELFCNSVYWLAHMQQLIAISPAAMQVSRIADMSDNVLRAWRVGLLLIGLPGLVLVLGLGVYFARRD